MKLNMLCRARGGLQMKLQFQRDFEFEVSTTKIHGSSFKSKERFSSTEAQTETYQEAISGSHVSIMRYVSEEITWKRGAEEKEQKVTGGSCENSVDIFKEQRCNRVKVRSRLRQVSYHCDNFKPPSPVPSPPPTVATCHHRSIILRGVE